MTSSKRLVEVRDMLEKEYEERGFTSLLGVAVGAASVCWDTVESAGVFHSEEASEIVTVLQKAHDMEMKKARHNLLGLAQPYAVDAHSAKSGLFDPRPETPKQGEGE